MEKETLSSVFPGSILSVTTGNKLVSKEVSTCYRGHILQQAEYQEVPYMFSQETYPRNIVQVEEVRYAYNFIVEL
jgi:hypothetical protein